MRAPDAADHPLGTTRTAGAASPDHAEGLWQAADDEVFANLPYDRPASVEAVREWIRSALGRPQLRLPFAVVVGGGAIGTTSYWYPDPVRRQIEIGSTWLGRSWWGTGINGEVKRLLVGHAITGMACDKVVFRTDPANTRSQQALERLGRFATGWSGGTGRARTVAGGTACTTRS